MIGIRLRGGLGNQMFQYAAARSLAERLDCVLVTSDRQVGRGLVSAAHSLKLRRQPPAGGVPPKGLLRKGLKCAPRLGSSGLREVALPSEIRMVFPRTYTPPLIRDPMNFERYDVDFFEQPSGTWLRGYFQSERYFMADDRVRRWFVPRDHWREEIDRLARELPMPPEASVAIHVRRGDYTRMTNPLSGGDGWALPIEYYRRALDLVPPDAQVLIFSDDPEWASKQFADLRPLVLGGNPAVVDMFLMARCRWVVTANSSFSWWAGWLNSHPAKTVFAPLHHLGWRIGRWVPEGIEVPGWRYLSALD